MTLDDHIEALDNLCGKAGLAYHISYTYPVTFTFTRRQTNMFSGEQRTACIKIVYAADDTTIQVEGDISIDDDTLTKIRNTARKIHYSWLQHWYAEAKARHKACVTPVFPCHEGRRYMALVARGYRG
jgi:hypothetical protein